MDKRVGEVIVVPILITHDPILEMLVFILRNIIFFVTCPIYRFFLIENEEIKCQIDDLTQKGHIQPKSSSYEIPIIFVQWKNGTWKLWICYIALNKIIVKN